MLRAAAVVGMALGSLMLCGLSQRPLMPEPAIKAAFLLKFADFTTWPPPPADRFTVCLSVGHPFETTFDTLAQTAVVQGRPVVVRTLKWAESPASCQLAFVASTDLRWLNRLTDLPILTVGDTADFCDRGGIVNFRIERGRVRFEVALDNARRVGLGIDPQLLRLATRVYRGGR